MTRIDPRPGAGSGRQSGGQPGRLPYYPGCVTAANDRATGTKPQAAQLTPADSGHPEVRFEAGAAADEMKYVRLQSG